MDLDEWSSLRDKLEKLNEMERGKASSIVTDVLKFLMDELLRHEQLLSDGET